MKLSDLEPSKNIKLLVFGDSGAGKTTFSCGFPAPLHVCDFDLKVTSAANYYQGTDQLQGITYEQYPMDKSNPADSGRRFNNDMSELKKLARDGNFPYKTLVIDSLTTMSDRIMEYLMKENTGIKRTITKGGQAPALQDYGVFRIFMKQMIGELLSLPCNVIFTAHIEVLKDEMTGALLRVPMLTGKLAKELPIYFEEVYWAHVVGEGDKKRHVAQTQSDSKFNCRSQIKGLPKLIDLKYEELIKGR